MDPKRVLTTVTKQWIELDDAINERRKELRALVAQQRDTSQQLSTIMQRLEIKDLGLGSNVGGVLRHKVSHTLAPITKQHVETVLRRYIQNDGAVQQIVRAIFQDERPRTEKTVLRRFKK